MKKVEIYKNGVDTGTIGNNQNWWFDLNHPDSFELFDIDSFYSDVYFATDHVPEQETNKFVNAIKIIFNRITNKELKTVLEAGAGGGWFTKAFLNNNINIISLEGTQAGYKKCLKEGIKEEIIFKHDLRKEIVFNKKFDISICTEVAEHIEIPFSSQLILTLVKHSDLVWFSFEAPGTNQAHYHHCNEQPEKFWINLFDFYNYGALLLPRLEGDNNIGLYGNRGTHLFYNRDVYEDYNLSNINLYI